MKYEYKIVFDDCLLESFGEYDVDSAVRNIEMYLNGLKSVIAFDLTFKRLFN